MNAHDTKQPATTDVAEELTRLRTDLGRLAESVAELVKSQTQTIAGNVREQAGKASDAIAANFADIGSTASKITNEAQASVQSASHDLETTIERNPMAAVLIAAGVGLFVGLVTART